MVRLHRFGSPGGVHIERAAQLGVDLLQCQRRIHRTGDPVDHVAGQGWAGSWRVGKDADDRNRILALLAQLVAEGERIGRCAEKLQQDQIDMRFLGEEGARLANILGRIDGLELLAVESLEQIAPVIAIGRNNQYRTIAVFAQHDVSEPSGHRANVAARSIRHPSAGAR